MHRLKSYPCHTISCSHRLSSHPTLQPLSRLLLVAIFCADFVLAFVRLACSLAAEASHQKRRPMHVAHLLVLQKGVHGSNLGGVSRVPFQRASATTLDLVQLETRCPEWLSCKQLGHRKFLAIETHRTLTGLL
jgi:hypothetical protein